MHFSLPYSTLVALNASTTCRLSLSGSTSNCSTPSCFTPPCFTPPCFTPPRPTPSSLSTNCSTALSINSHTRCGTIGLLTCAVRQKSSPRSSTDITHG